MEDKAENRVWYTIMISYTERGRKTIEARDRHDVARYFPGKRAQVERHKKGYVIKGKLDEEIMAKVCRHQK